MKKFLKNWFRGIKSRWLLILLACVVWTALAYLWRLGKNNIAYMAMYYLTGALLGVDSNNIIGGVIGKSILLIVVNGFLTSLFMHKGSLRVRLHYAKKSMTEGLKKLNDYVASFAAFQSKDSKVIVCGIGGAGISFIFNAFITGNAAFVNSFVNVALFAVCINQIQEKRGFLIACANVMLQKFGYKEVNNDSVIGMLDGIALGCLLAPLTYFIPVNGITYIIGSICLAMGMGGLLVAKKEGGQAHEN